MLQRLIKINAPSNLYNYTETKNRLLRHHMLSINKRPGQVRQKTLDHSTTRNDETRKISESQCILNDLDDEIENHEDIVDSLQDKSNSIDSTTTTRNNHIYNWHKGTPLKLRDEIINIVEDLYKRHGDYVGSEMKDILLEYQDRIGREKFDIGQIPGVTYKVHMKPNIDPIGDNPRRQSPKQDEEIRKTVETLLKYGLIEPYEGPWGCPTFCVRNPDGSTRMVCDYRKPNAVSYSDTYPTPSVQDIISQFHGKTIYSSLDILKAFFNVKVDPESKQYTAFVTKYGVYVWNVMPFGGKNCPSTWARASDRYDKICG